MASLNKVFLIGNLTRDPEMRVTAKGTAICQFGLAINRQFKDESGTSKDETTFIDCEAWAKTAELVAKYLAKGAQCMAEGRLKLDTWDDKTSGQKRSKLKVVVENVQFLGAKTSTAQPAQPQEPAQARFTPGGGHTPTAPIDDEQVPF